MIRSKDIKKVDYYFNRVSFELYKVGEGILNSITLDDDYELLEKDI